jgi:tellurite resistance protein TehA-like permease
MNYEHFHRVWQVRTTPAPVSGTRHVRFPGTLANPGDVFRELGLNWFGSVMGTGIVANAAVLLPTHVPGLRTFALAFWLLAATALVILVVATALHWLRPLEHGRRHRHDPAMAPKSASFSGSMPGYGALAMALLTVGSGALGVGGDLVGLGAAVRIDEVLWTLGTITGLLGVIALPYLAFSRYKLRLEDTSGAWMMPIVPPMVSAATGAALIAHLPAGQPRLTLLVACYGMFGITLIASLITITLLCERLAFHGPGPARLVPTLWIVLGFLGQSVTAAALLGNAAAGTIQAPYAGALHAAAVVYGLPVWGFAVVWLAIMAAITVRAARNRLPFSLSWWSFTFPIGTFGTGTSVLAVSTHAAFLPYVSAALYALLIVAWLTDATRTTRGTLNGRLFHPAPAPAPSSS